MKTASVRELQHGLAAVLARVERGDTVTITRRGKVVARIVPPATAARVSWPDSMARMKQNFPNGIRGAAPSELVRSGREEDP